jgi:hypothetical protein
MTGLPPGVVDTRPPGLRVIDIRDGVELRDGVLDTRSLDLQGLVDIPPSPFANVTEAVGAASRVPQNRSGEVVEVSPEAPAVEPTIEEEQAEVRRDVAAPATRSPYMRRSELRRLEARAARRVKASGLSVPQVGIAGALGLATIAAPLTGALSAPLQAGANQLSGVVSTAIFADAPAQVAAPFPQTETGPANGVEVAHVVVDDSQLTVVPSALAAPGRVLVSRASRGGTERAVLPGCDGVVSKAGQSAGNGRLPASALCTLWNGKESLRADAAVDLAKLNVAHRQAFGRDICIVDGYRTLSEQVQIKRLRGGFAAAPGTSEHGWGLAVDLCGGSGIASTATYTWLRTNAPRYGWHNPDWALPGGSGAYEPWHWEYFRGQDHVSGGD